MVFQVPVRTSVRSIRVLLSLSILALTGAGLSAKADTYDYTVTQGANTATFSLSSTAAPSSFFTGEGLIYDNIAVTLNGQTPVIEQVAFSSEGFAQLAIGGVTFGSGVEEISGSGYFYSFGPALYTGPEDDPVLSLGTFAASFSGVNVLNGSGTIMVTDASLAATPEPSSLVLVGSGVLGLAGIVRRRFVR